ncbi:hypothetical protein TrVFT333_003250 [Trichoderma virens FT-333]|nr:hypothetical protein TrVFT333_003250 [Trichoderma virens FT-333]
MASPRPTPSATLADPLPSPLPAVPRRVQELKNSSHRKLKTRSRETTPKDTHRSRHRRWREEIISNLEDDETFNNHLAILKIVRRIPELGQHVPQLVSNNPVTRTYIVKYPPRDLIHFEKEARFMHLSYREIQGLKSQLYRSVKAMYTNGVRYNIHPHRLYMHGSASWNRNPLLFLGSVTSSDLIGAEQLDWQEQRDRVCAQIDRVFAPLEIWSFQEEAARLADYARKEMDEATSTINDKNPVIDAAKADLTEAQAIMAEAYQMIKDARAAMDGVKTISKEIYTSVIRPQGAWDRAHIGKEDAETCLKKTHVLNDRANALIQKYGNLKPYNGVGAGDAISHPEPKPEENVEMVDSNASADDAKAVEESTTQDGLATDEPNLREDGTFGT